MSKFLVEKQASKFGYIYCARPVDGLTMLLMIMVVIIFDIVIEFSPETILCKVRGEVSLGGNQSELIRRSQKPISQWQPQGLGM